MVLATGALTFTVIVRLLPPAVAVIFAVPAATGFTTPLEVTVATFSSLVRPHESVNYFVEGLTGITDDMVWSADLPKSVLPEFYAFLGDDVLMGHNVNYDVNVLYDNFMRYLELPLVNDFVDVLRLSKQLLPDLPCHKQTYIAEYFGIDTTGAHRALTDCEICHQNYLKLREIAKRC